MTQTPDNIAKLPLTLEEIEMGGLIDHLDGIAKFLHRYRDVLPPEIDCWEDLEDAVSVMSGALEDMAEANKIHG